MKIRIVAIAVAAALALAAAETQAQTAQAGAQGIYIGIQGGWTDLEPITLRGITLKNRDGYNLGVNGGYAFGNGVRLEAEVPYRENDARAGQFNSIGLMANALYDFFPTKAWTPYLGVGIGGMRVEQSGHIAGLIGLGGDSDFQFAYQGIAGIKYAFSPNWSASLDYRYLATTDASLKAQYDGNYKAPYATHNVIFGITYHFAPPPPPPPPAPPPPSVAPAPAAAPPPPAQHNFIVFFEFDRATLTDDGKKVVEAAAEYAKTHGTASIDLGGYTDTVGTASYNVALSKRRADTVTRYLERLGIPQRAIKEAWYGKEHLRVPTPDGVREPQNRRVEIVMP